MRPENALMARLCHDLITPFNAINIGIEAYEMSKDSSLLEGVRDSANKANAILKFMRELYSVKSETFYYSIPYLEGLISDFLINYNMAFSLKSDSESIPNITGKIMMYNAIIAKEIMPFGGTVSGNIDNTHNEISILCSGNNVSIPDVNPQDEPDHKNIIRHSLTKLLEEVGLKATAAQVKADVVMISEKMS